MKSTFIYILLLLAICASVYFTYQRSFVTQDFEVINSEEEEATEEEEAGTEALEEETPMESDESTDAQPI